MQTRCPHCQTRFRVTTEQLKLRQGQVRCGACRAVFDALDSLSDEPVIPIDRIAEAANEVNDANEPAAEPESGAELVQESAAETPVAPEGSPPVPMVKPARRWPWMLGSVVLLLAGVAQLAYLFRVELAVVAPAARPALVAGCELLGCELPRPRKTEQIDIEASGLAPQGTGLLLTATLRNRAHFDQEYPHLELTLTDTQDVPLVRRVITPAEYLPAGQAPNAGFAARGAIDIKLALTTDDVPAVGYRLYFFFP